MTTAAEGALRFIFNPTPADKALILTDEASFEIAAAFREALKRFNCGTDLFKIPEEARPLEKIPEELNLLLSGKTIVLNIITALPEEIAFRIQWIFKVEENKKTKMAHMPGITEGMMMRSVHIDFESMLCNARRLHTYLNNAAFIHFTTAAGTDLKLDVRGRIFSIEPAEEFMVNLPCGEIYCAPVETGADGIVVFDASIGDVGILKKPVIVHLSGGLIKMVESEDEELVKKINELICIDEQSKMIGELGIGINPGAVITGSMLEDEKALHTAHLAFGNNEDFPGGGKNSSRIHRDFLFYYPTIEVTYSSGGTRIIMKDGNITV